MIYIILQVYNKPPGQHLMGIFYSGHGQLLLCQFISVVVIVGWAVRTAGWEGGHRSYCVMNWGVRENEFYT